MASATCRSCSGTLKIRLLRRQLREIGFACPIGLASREDSLPFIIEESQRKGSAGGWESSDDSWVRAVSQGVRHELSTCGGLGGVPHE